MDIVESDFLVEAQQQVDAACEERHEEEPLPETGSVEAFDAEADMLSAYVHEPALQMVLDLKAGEPEDWNKEMQGGGFFLADGAVRDAEGNEWKDLDPEMVIQWKEGGDPNYRLPDHIEEGEEMDKLYVTVMHFDRNSGEVSYSIFSHDIPHARDDEATVAPRELERTEEDYIALWQEFFDEELSEKNAELADEMMEAVTEVMQETEVAAEDGTEKDTTEPVEKTKDTDEAALGMVPEPLAVVTPEKDALVVVEKDAGNVSVTMSELLMQEIFDALLDDEPLEITETFTPVQVEAAVTVPAFVAQVVEPTAESPAVEEVPDQIITIEATSIATEQNEVVETISTESESENLVATEQQESSPVFSETLTDMVDIAGDEEAEHTETNTVVEQTHTVGAPIAEGTAPVVEAPTNAITEGSTTETPVQELEVSAFQPSSDAPQQAVETPTVTNERTIRDVVAPKEEVAAKTEPIRMDIVHTKTEQRMSARTAAQKNEAAPRSRQEKTEEILRVLGKPANDNKEKAEFALLRAELFRPLFNKPSGFTPRARAQSTAPRYSRSGITMEIAA